MSFSLEKYGERLELIDDDDSTITSKSATLSALTVIMEAHVRLIPFENMSVVLGDLIDISPDSVAEKLVTRKRGGYCYEQHVLLHSALSAMGYTVSMVLARVRWGLTPDDTTPFTHVVLIVDGSDFSNYLVDVGFGGNNCPEPIALGHDMETQVRVSGVYRTVTDVEGEMTTLEVQDRNDPTIFRPLYAWSVVRWETEPDFVVANWFSCTFPKARFTQEFYVAKIANGEKHLILNDVYLRRSLTSGEVLEKRKVESLDALLDLVRDTFGLEIESDVRLGRYL